jgi:hypothetical protein
MQANTQGLTGLCLGLPSLALAVPMQLAHQGAGGLRRHPPGRHQPQPHF